MSRPIEEQREKLVKFAAQLRRLTFPSSPLSIDLVEYVAAAIESYCSGKDKTMDAALKLSKKRGAPGDPAKRERIAREIHGIRKAGGSWKKATKEIGAREPGYTETVTLKRIAKEFEKTLPPKLVSERLAEELRKEGWLLVT